MFGDRAIRKQGILVLVVFIVLTAAPVVRHASCGDDTSLGFVFEHDAIRLGTDCFQWGGCPENFHAIPGTEMLVTCAMSSVDVWDRSNGLKLTSFSVRGACNIVGADITPDGKTLVTVNEEGRLDLHDLTDPKRSRHWMVLGPEPEGIFTGACSISNDGKWITAMTEAKVFVYFRDSEDLQRVLTSEDQNGFAVPFKACFLPKSTTLVTASCGAKFRLWDVSTGDLVKRVDVQGRQADGWSLSPDGSRIFGFDFNGGYLIHLADSQVRQVAKDDVSIGEGSCSFSADSNVLYACRLSAEAEGVDGSVTSVDGEEVVIYAMEQYDSDSGELVGSSELIFNSDVFFIMPALDKKSVTVFLYSGRVYEVELDSGLARERQLGHVAPVTDVKFLSDQEVVSASALDSHFCDAVPAVCVWNIHTPKNPAWKSKDIWNGAVSVEVRCNDRAVLIATSEGLELLDPDSGELEFLMSNEEMSGVARYAGGGNRILRQDRTSVELESFDSKSFQREDVAYQFLDVESSCCSKSCLAISESKGLIAVGGSETPLQVVKVKDGSPVFRWESECVSAVAFSPDGSVLIVARACMDEESACSVDVIDVSTFKTIFSIESVSEVAALQVCPDSKTLLLGAGTGIEVWDIPLMIRKDKFPNRSGNREAEACVLSVSADASLFAAGNLDGSVFVYRRR